MIDLNTALAIHEKSIKFYGGGNGLRDKGALLAALARPYQTFGQQELYLLPTEKAAAIFESLIINHPFIDGNKRTAYILLRATLSIYNLDIVAFEDEKYKMTIAASSGEIRFEEIKLWIENHLVSITT
ncbi:MAG: type II toxin-antitoxin system death-on-curing family toxin [Mucilaginibacter sp.]